MMQCEGISKKIYKHDGVDLPRKNDYFWKQNLERVTLLREEYESIRPRLLFLAEHDPTCDEYRDLYRQGKRIFNELLKIINTI